MYNLIYLNVLYNSYNFTNLYLFLFRGGLSESTEYHVLYGVLYEVQLEIIRM